MTDEELDVEMGKILNAIDDLALRLTLPQRKTMARNVSEWCVELVKATEGDAAGKTNGPRDV